MTSTTTKTPTTSIAKALAEKTSTKSTVVTKPGFPKALAEKNRKHQHDAELAADVGRDQHDRKHAHGVRGTPPVRLLDKRQILSITGVSFPTVWSWMRAGKFPRSRVVGGKSKWLNTEVDQWIANLQVRPLKGDQSEAA